MTNKTPAIFFAILAAVLYGISSPLAKLLLEEIEPTLMAALLYLGAGFGMLAIHFLKRLSKHEVVEARLTRNELPFTLGMIVLDIAAPIFLMFALTFTTAANVSLLNNFEIVATAMIALIVFKEAIGRRVWLAIILITLASILLTFEDSSFNFSIGSVFVLLACISWGLENNLTRKLSLKDPVQIVILKGLGSGTGALMIAFFTGVSQINFIYAAIAMLLGFVAFGLSIYFYILAQRTLGAARTSAYYAIAPFVGVLISIIIFGQPLTWSFLTACLLMIIGAYFAAAEQHRHRHIHVETAHEHRHTHQDGHHTHNHAAGDKFEHSHVHQHEQVEHSHKHTPDTHHTHSHRTK